MRFSVIYEFDCPMGLSVTQFTPTQRHLFDLTEQADGEPSEWCGDLWGGKVKHRKYCALLTRKQFERFLSDTGLFPEDVETLGSLGAPGYGLGFAPAISFRNDDPEAIQSAYVTPLPEVEPKRELTPKRCEQVWQRVRRAIFSVYG